MEGKKSITPSTPKPTKAQVTASKTGTKASTLIANSVVNIQDELQIYFQKNFFGMFALAFLSKSICMTSVALGKQQAFERIAQLTSLVTNLMDTDSIRLLKLIDISFTYCTKKTQEKYRMPVPMISVLQNGKGFAGKQNFVKEFILMPKPNVKLQDVNQKENNFLLIFLFHYNQSIYF